MWVKQLFPSPPEWQWRSLGDVCEAGGGDVQTGPFGSQLHAADYVESGIPSIMPQNIGDNRIEVADIARITPVDAKRLSRYLVREGDIVYSRRGDVERRALVRQAEDGWLCGTGCLRVRLGKGPVDALYASFYLGHPTVRRWIVQHAIGATMPNLNTSIMSALPMLVPPLPEQKAIAHVLGTLDDKIELNRRMNRTLEEMARALFRAWFVDFEPVRAKMAGRAPASCSPEIAALFPDRLVPSALGLVPAGWGVGTISDIAEINSWTLGRNDDLAELEYIEISGVSTGRVLETSHHERASAPSRARRRLRHGDSVVSTVRPTRKSYFLVLHPSDNLIASTGFAVLTPKRVPWSFLYVMITQDVFYKYLGKLETGAAYPAVSPAIIGEWEAALPPSSEVLNAYHAICGPLLERIHRNDEESRSLSHLRDTLLPKLISGKVRVHPQGVGSVWQG